MTQIQARGTSTVGSAHLDQDRRLKPTSVFGLLEQLLPHTWQALAGMSRDAYFATHPARLVFAHLRIERLPCRLRLDETVRLEFDGRVGQYPGRDGMPRYGLKDRFTIRASDGTPAAHWTAEVFWVRTESEGAGGFLGEPAPGLLHDQSAQLEPPPTRPDAQGDPAGAFRWTPRETDFNRHVYFAAYLERAENGLMDADVDPSASTAWDVWFTRPTFVGDHIRLTLRSGPDGHVVGMHRGDDLCAVLAAT